MVDQVNGSTVVDSATHVNRKLTLGENIAGLGGLRIAYLAFQKALAKERAQGRPSARVDGFTPEQRLCLAWARVWREQMHEEALRTLVHTNPRAPAQWRVNGPLSNMPEFAAAWKCQPSDAMVRPDSLRARIC